MTKERFFKELKWHLSGVSERDLNEILADYEEHFEFGKQAGKNEEEIAESLGNPKVIATSIKAEELFTKAETASSQKERFSIVFKILFAILILAPLNFILLAGPLFAIVIMVFVGWIIPFAGTLASLKSIHSFFIMTTTIDIWAKLSYLFDLLGTWGACALGFIAMGYISKFIFDVIIKYMKWNINLIKEKSN